MKHLCHELNTSLSKNSFNPIHPSQHRQHSHFRLRAVLRNMMSFCINLTQTFRTSSKRYIISLMQPEKNKRYSTRDSRGIPDLSTKRARRGLTALFEMGRGVCLLGVAVSVKTRRRQVIYTVADVNENINKRSVEPKPFCLVLLLASQRLRHRNKYDSRTAFKEAAKKLFEKVNATEERCE